jgi:hypothetical protein
MIKINVKLVFKVICKDVESKNMTGIKSYFYVS